MRKSPKVEEKTIRVAENDAITTTEPIYLER